MLGLPSAPSHNSVSKLSEPFWRAYTDANSLGRTVTDLRMLNCWQVTSLEFFRGKAIENRRFCQIEVRQVQAVLRGRLAASASMLQQMNAWRRGTANAADNRSLARRQRKRGPVLSRSQSG
jgi:hypothetical protein